MSDYKIENGCVAKPIVDDLKAKMSLPKPAEPVTSNNPKPAELDKDPGSGFNANGTYPQA